LLIPYLMIGHSPYGLSVVTYYFIILIHGMVLTAMFRATATFTANATLLPSHPQCSPRESKSGPQPPCVFLQDSRCLTSEQRKKLLLYIKRC
jgi:hypothetical protein